MLSLAHLPSCAPTAVLANANVNIHLDHRSAIARSSRCCSIQVFALQNCANSKSLTLISRTNASSSWAKGQMSAWFPSRRQQLRLSGAICPLAQDSANSRVFVSSSGHPIECDDLAKLLARIRRRAGVVKVHSHRFRHTFAINFWRNGGNAYALQMVLGHSTIEMVKRYLALAQADVEAAHRQASPVASWRL